MHCQDQNLLHKKLVLEKFMSKKERDRDNEISIVIGCMWSNISGLLLLDESAMVRKIVINLGY